MAIIGISQWKEALSSINAFKQSDALKDVTKYFEIYSQRNTQSNLDNLSRYLEVWSTTGPISERTTLLQAQNDLIETIAGAKAANSVIVTRASQVGQNRFYQIKPLDLKRQGWASPILDAADPDFVPPFTPAQIMRMNEAFNRAYDAAVAARDAAASFASKAPGATKLVDRNFVTFFGAYSQQRARKVANNYKDIVDSLDSKVIIYDIRNCTNFKDNFAMCWQGHVLRDTVTKKSTSQIEMFIGRGFFTSYSADGEDKFRGTTASTVWTLVHELAHGAFHAVDAPRVFDGHWELEPDKTGGVDSDNYGATPDNALQSSSRELDTALALKDPDVAIRNADSYGLFAYCSALGI